jgi:hypothetical protein
MPSRDHADWFVKSARVRAEVVDRLPASGPQLDALRQAQGTFVVECSPARCPSAGSGHSYKRSDLVPRLSKHMAQDLLHLVELGLATDQWWSDLYDGVAAVVGAAVEAVLEQRP